MTNYCCTKWAMAASKIKLSFIYKIADWTISMYHLHFEWVAIGFACHFVVLQRHSHEWYSNVDCCDKKDAVMQTIGGKHHHRSFAMCDCSIDLMFPVLVKMENYDCSMRMKKKIKPKEWLKLKGIRTFLVTYWPMWTNGLSFKFNCTKFGAKCSASGITVNKFPVRLSVCNERGAWNM